MNFLDLQDISFQYPGKPPVIEGLTLTLAAGEVHCLVGRSGCGKTTVLKLAAGLLAPSAGRVLLRGGAILDPKQIGYVFQAPTLLEWLSVRDNVLLPISIQRRPGPVEARAAEALLARLGVADLASRYPRQLSGGQQSRVALARSLFLSPPLLLLDEPFAALDALTREEIQRDLRELVKARNTTVLFVTHDVGEAVFLSDRISVLAERRLVHTITSLPNAERDSTAFGAVCGELRAVLAQAGSVRAEAFA